MTLTLYDIFFSTSQYTSDLSRLTKGMFLSASHGRVSSTCAGHIRATNETRYENYNIKSQPIGRYLKRILPVI